jgi:hypothetical protein
MTVIRLALPLALALSFVAGTAVAANDSKDPKPAAAKPAAKPAATKPAAPAAAPVQGRDWSKIDTNGDNLVSPEEMEDWLKKNPGPQK